MKQFKGSWNFFWRVFSNSVVEIPPLMSIIDEHCSSSLRISFNCGNLDVAAISCVTGLLVAD